MSGNVALGFYARRFLHGNPALGDNVPNAKETHLNEIQSVIAQLELQRASIDRALEALREIEGTIRGAKYGLNTNPRWRVPVIPAERHFMYFALRAKGGAWLGQSTARLRPC